MRLCGYIKFGPDVTFAVDCAVKYRAANSVSVVVVTKMKSRHTDTGQQEQQGEIKMVLSTAYLCGGLSSAGIYKLFAWRCLDVQKEKKPSYLLRVYHPPSSRNGDKSSEENGHTRSPLTQFHTHVNVQLHVYSGSPPECEFSRGTQQQQQQKQKQPVE